MIGSLDTPEFEIWSTHQTPPRGRGIHQKGELLRHKILSAEQTKNAALEGRQTGEHAIDKEPRVRRRPNCDPKISEQ
jgi:hypothetical protein